MIVISIRKQDVLAAIVTGTILTAGLNIWYNLIANAGTIDGYMWLWHLQEPGARTGERLAAFLYPRIGNPWSVRWGVTCAYTVLVTLWALVVLAAIILKRRIASVHIASASTSALESKDA